MIKSWFKLAQSRPSAVAAKAVTAAATSNRTGLFGNLLLSRPQGFNNLADIVERKAVELVRHIVERDALDELKTSGDLTTVSLVDDLSNEICCAADLSDCVRSMHCDPAFSKAAEASMRKYTVLVETLNTTPELYQALKNSLNTERKYLDDVSMRTANLLLEDFKQSGVHLQEEERKKFVTLSDEIFEAGMRFVEGTDQPVQVDTSTHTSTISHPNTSSADYGIRRSTFSKFFAHRESQEKALYRLISCRDQLARLTGFESFAHRAQSHSVLRTYDNVYAFLDGTIKAMRPLLEEDLEMLKRVVADNSKNFDPLHDRVGEWDLDFAAGIQRQRIFESLGPIHEFFSFASVLSGFEHIVSRLYGLSFKSELPGVGEVWEGNVLKLNVHDQSNNFLGSIYLDIDARPTKVQGDCHFTVRCSKLMRDETYQTPIVVVSLSLVSPTVQNLKGKLSKSTIFDSVTMHPQQAENFFHEMGHAIHSILGRTRFQHVAGTRCPTDFAEVPSHLMECFFDDPKVLTAICKDKSGRALSIDQAEAIVATRGVFASTRILQQSLYALVDLQLHGPYAKAVASGELSTTGLFNQLVGVALPGLEPVSISGTDYAYHHRISHLVTYGAKYYSYLVARASALKIYTRLFADDPFSRENGQKWAKVQSYGGEYESSYLLQQIFEEEPEAKALIEVLRQSPKM